MVALSLLQIGKQLPMASRVQGIGFFLIKKWKHTQLSIKLNTDFFWQSKICFVSLCFNTMKARRLKPPSFSKHL